MFIGQVALNDGTPKSTIHPRVKAYGSHHHSCQDSGCPEDDLTNNALGISSK